jgi:hypothetical protein
LILAGTEVEQTEHMTLWSVVAACAFVAVLGALVACVDRWRDARLSVVAPVAGRRPVAPVARAAAVAAARKRAA